MNVPPAPVARVLTGGATALMPGAAIIDRLAATLVGLRGRRRWLAAFLLGALAIPALPPLYVLPVLIPCFTGLLWLLRGTSGWRSATAIGCFFGLGYYTAGLYWVANALLTKPEQYGLLAPLAPIGLAAILTPMVAVGVVATRVLAPEPGVGRVVVFAATWTFGEWLRSWVLTGFPWNLIGSVWSFAATTLQPASWFGVYLLSLVTVLAAAMPALLSPPGEAGRRAWRGPLLAFVLLAAVLAAGGLRLLLAASVGTVPDVRLRLIQPNISQSIKWRRDLVDQHLRLQAEMGSSGNGLPPTHVIWSEVAAPLFVVEDPARLALIGAHTPNGGLSLVGTLRRSDTNDRFTLWNSMVAVDGGGRVVATYDKSHLVPFGEFMPLRDILGIANLTVGFADFTPGPGLMTLRLAGLPPLGPLICYEAIFPGAVARTDDRPAWLLNLTNDGWYGHSTGPYQHFAAARMRAVEEGLPLVRVANTGISAIIDPYGRIEMQLGFGVQGVLDGALPAALPGPTVYSRVGNTPIIVLSGALLLAGSVASRRKSPLFGEFLFKKTK